MASASQVLPTERATRRRLARRAFALLAAAALGACAGPPMPRGQVLVQTRGGEEQGISTPFGVVLLGRTAREGRCDVVVLYGDGPSVEPGTIERLGDELCVATLELKAPTTELSFTYPYDDEPLLLGISLGSEPEFFETKLATEAGVTGTAVAIPRGFPLTPAIAGAGIYRFEDNRFRLVGIVNGMARFTDPKGSPREVFTFLGPRHLSALLLLERDRGRTNDPRERIDIRH